MKMFACITSVARRLPLPLALALSVGSADARANVESRSEPDVKFDRYWREPEEPRNDLLFYRPLIAWRKGEGKPSCPQPNETRRSLDPR